MAAASPADWAVPVQAAFEKYPAPEKVKYAYGTAGFRMKAEDLDAACVRTGALAAIRALQFGKVRTRQPGPPQFPLRVTTPRHRHDCRLWV